jgi:hypothetical protein
MSGLKGTMANGGDASKRLDHGKSHVPNDANAELRHEAAGRGRNPRLIR